MSSVSKIFVFVLGLSLGLLGLVVLALGLWVVEMAYFDVLKTGVFGLTFAIDGHSIPIPVVIAVLGVTSCALIAFAGIVIGRNNPFASPIRFD